jgi:Periplasmic copper-binding protein (NosD)
MDDGIFISPVGGVLATLNRVTANNNAFGVATVGNHDTTLANSIISNNGAGVYSEVGVAWLAKTVISGNGTGVVANGTVNSYRDNYIRDNGTPVSGTITGVSTE